MSLNPRKLSVDIIYSVTKKHSNLSDELDNVRRQYLTLSELDIRFITEITNGVLRNLEYINYAISLASDIKLNKISPYVLCVLRTGVYQILFMDKVPESAAVNECVKIIKKSSNFRIAGFVNAVLRKVIQNGKEIKLPDDPIKHLSIKYSCPEWIVKSWSDDLGKDTENLLKAMNQKPATILRVNKLKTNREELIKILNSEGWECEPYVSELFKEVDYLISATKVGNLETSPAFKKGLFYIQDPAAAYVGEVLSPLPGSVVFDMCASPGGKTTHFAEKMLGSGTVYAFDVSEAKIKRIKNNAERLGLNNITAYVNDSAMYNPDYAQKADYLLVDAPCSGLGIIRKKPDIKYLRKEADSTDLAEISLNILKTSASYVKHGGTMIFSTCTTQRSENEDVLFEFLKCCPEFRLKKIRCSVKNSGYLTLYPHIDDCDGFFISLMTKE
ncbi:MAG: 16S rRNA (cytosine(967)-C(5))-methyltransferase RsmB [Clostridia bacterium]|nr:16S rRNA (cytosine(967)-C(5))-methyltransferase RsmB [Clostridia bacterium]